MGKSVKIFKSFEEQEQYHKQRMLTTSPYDRFKALYEMQCMNKKFHPAMNTERKITILNGHSKS